MNNKLDRPKVVGSAVELRDAMASLRRRQERIGLVPTMGALHAGHLSLVQAARRECGACVVSIYVNPMQFGPQEDFSRYPRTLEADLDALAGAGTELVFVPTNEVMYPSGSSTWVEVGPVAEPLEGQCRPGHFRGVATVVLKLFNLVRADVAYFGQKDYQQVKVIQRMVADLDVPVEVRVCPTVREPDGLAMSSRNRYLDADARRRALVLWQSLELARRLVEQGERDTACVANAMREVIQSAEDARIDYVALVDPENLQPVDVIRTTTLAALAVRLGPTRLIDNCLLTPPVVPAH